MFPKESEMARAVVRWLRAGGMAVKSEFVTPWGICDLAGLSFNRKRVSERLQLKQTRPISSITRAVLLLQIPDIRTKNSITVERLVRSCRPAVPREVVVAEADRLVADRFVVVSERGRLQKVNGWMPLHDRLVAVELKLARIEDAMRQALGNLGFAEESYVGLPADVARRVASRPHHWSRYIEAGVGTLSIRRHACDVVIPARRGHEWTDPAVQLYCVEKFWRTRIRGN